jgi:hypothetical protein
MRKRRKSCRSLAFAARKKDPYSSLLCRPHLERLEDRRMLSSTGGNHEVFEILARTVAYEEGWEEQQAVSFDGNPLGYVVDKVFDGSLGFYALGLLSNTYGPALVIRGTELFGDWFIDLWEDSDPQGVGYGQFASNWGAVKDWLSEDADVAGKSVDIVGHSMGGALAQWIAAKFTSNGGQVDQLVTFNSPGISNSRSTYPNLLTYADEFVAGTASVTHYVVNGDPVSMAGEAFVSGNVKLASFSDRWLWDFDKHVLPLLVPRVLNPGTGEYRYRPSDVSQQDYLIDKLNSPLYSHTDADYRLTLLGAEIVLCSLAVYNPSFTPLVSVPAKLMFRVTTESVRRDVGTAIRAIEYGYQGRRPSFEFTADPSGNYLIKLGAKDHGLFKLADIAVDSEFVLTVDSGNPRMLRLDGGLSMNSGASANIGLPWWLGSSFVADHLVAMAGADVSGVIARNLLQVDGELRLLGSLIDLTGSAELNLQRGELSVDGTFDILEGCITGSGKANVSGNLDIVMAGSAEVLFPEHAPIIGGRQLAAGEFLLNYSNDLNATNDFVAGWGKIAGVPLGLRVWLDGRTPQILGAKEIKELEQQDGDGESGLPYSESYLIPSERDWCLLFAEWENSAAESSLHLRKPSGEVLSEADMAADPSITVIAELSDDKGKCIRIDKPEAGVWQLTLDDATGLGAVDMSAMVSEPLPTVNVLSARDGLFRQPIDVEIAASASDSDVSVALFYDTDANGLDGFMITDGLTPVDGIVTYTWDTKNVAAGEYFLYARALDEYNAPVYAYASRPVQISEDVLGAVVINKHSGQSDPTRRPTVDFSVVFKEPVSDFEDGDVTIGGTAGATTAVITKSSGDHVNYIVTVSGMVSTGTVIAMIPPDVAHDEAGNANVASISTDNEVTYICPWQNHPVPLDTNNDTYVFPIDALLVINELNRGRSGRLPNPAPDHQPPPYYDVNGDHYVSPIDALQVINYLNKGGGEGENGDTATDAITATAWSPMAVNTETHEVGGADGHNEERAGDSRADDSRQSTCALGSLDLLFAKLNESHRNQTRESVVDRTGANAGELEAFLESMLSGSADEELDTNGAGKGTGIDRSRIQKIHKSAGR